MSRNKFRVNEFKCLEENVDKQFREVREKVFIYTLMLHHHHHTLMLQFVVSLRKKTDTDQIEC